MEVENIPDMVVEMEVVEALYKEVKGVAVNKWAVEAGMDKMVVGENVAEMVVEENLVEMMVEVVVNCSEDLEVVVGNLVESECSIQVVAVEKVVVVEEKMVVMDGIQKNYNQQA